MTSLRVLRIDGYRVGRNFAESLLARGLSRILPHTYRVLAETTS